MFVQTANSCSTNTCSVEQHSTHSWALRHRKDIDTMASTAASLAPYTVVVPSRMAAGRPSVQIFVRRRLLVSLVLVAIVVVVWLGAGSVLANREGDTASASTVRPASSPHVYVARSGDTLWSIAQRFHEQYSQANYLDALISINHGSSVQIGQAITLP